MTNPSVLYVRIPPVPADIEPAWNTWYDREHIAYRLPMPGFRGARRYRVGTGPVRYVALYELDDPDVLTGERYLAHRRWEEAVPPPAFEAIAPRLPGFGRGVYEQRVPAVDRYRAPQAGALLIVDLDGSNAARSGHGLQSLAGELIHADGVLAVRCLELSGASLGAGSGQRTGGPRMIALLDLADAEVAAVPGVRAALEHAWHPGSCPAPASISWLGAQVYSSFQAAVAPAA